MEQKFRNYTFTSFDEGEPIEGSFKYKYLAYARETCPTTGKDHWQGFICLHSPRTFRSMMKSLPGWHLECMKGNIQQNVSYCSKQGNLIEHGIKPCQGKRFDLDELKKCTRMAEVTSIARSNNDIRLMENYLKYHEKKRDWPTEVFWFWGPPGTGKTRRAIAEAGSDYWISLKDGRWFEGYDAHEHVIFDDVRIDFMPFNVWLRILDRYPYTVEVKGSSRQFLAKKIWITSCHSPEQMFSSKINEDITQLTRRLTTIIEIGSEVEGNTRPLLLKW